MLNNLSTWGRYRLRKVLDLLDARETPETAPRPAASAPEGQAVPDAWERQTDITIPTYPPFRQGLPAVSADLIVQTQSMLIRDLYSAVGIDKTLWRKLYMPIILRYAGHAHLLPASENNHHRGAGGLFRHGLEAALYAVRLVDGKDSLEKSAFLLHPQDRILQESRLRFSVFCAALLHDAGKPISDSMVNSADGNDVWNPLLEGLPEWASRTATDHYHIHWRANRKSRHEAVTAVLFPRLVGEYAMGWLHEADPSWVDLVSKSLVSYETGVNRVRDFATYGDKESVRLDLRGQGIEGDGIGVPIERHILAAMREMVFDGSWQPDVKGGMLWVCEAPDDHVGRSFAPGTPLLALAWPRAGETVIAKLRRDGMPGVPNNPALIASMLLERGIAVPFREESSGGDSRIDYWYLQPPAEQSGIGASTATTPSQQVLVLSSPEYLLNPAPVPGKYRLNSGRQQPQESAGAGTANTLVPAPATPAPQHPKNSGQEKAGNANKNAAAKTQNSPLTGPRTEAITAPPMTEPQSGPALSSTIVDSDQKTTAVRILTTISMDLLLRRRNAGLVTPAGNSAWLRFPEALQNMGYKPIDILKLLAADGYLSPDPTNPEVLTQKMTLPGTDKAVTVAVLTEKAIAVAPCLGISHNTQAEDHRSALEYLLATASQCPAGRFVAAGAGSSKQKDPTASAGFWFLPVHWVVQQLHGKYPGVVCPEMVLRTLENGPGNREEDGPLVRVPAQLDEEH